MCAPVFHYLPVCDAENGHSCKRNPLTGGWCMHEQTCVCTSEGITLYHLISLRNQTLGGDMKLGKAARNVRWTILPPSRPDGSPGIPLWLLMSTATTSSKRARLFVLCASRERRTRTLFASVDIEHIPLCSKEGMIVRSLECQNIVVISPDPRQIDRGDVQWQLLGKRRSREVPKLILWGEKSHTLLSRNHTISQ